MTKNQKIELTWVGKDERPKPEPHILLEDASLSRHAKHCVTDGDIFDNRLIFGDNLLALKALEQEFAGKVKCVFIDPPYNTGSAFTHWSKDEVGSNRVSKNEMRALFPGDESFGTPKPERLPKRVIEIATNPGNLVPDSFAGSGTTGAVAHRMGRRWIMVELGEHIHTHIIPRLKKVIDGQDKGGVTESTGWQGGGFRYYKLASSLIVNDRWGNPVINPDYNAAQLAEALCKLEGFTYAPSETRWWQHGHSSERDFLYVTTQNLSAEQLQALSDDVGSDSSLLIMCSAFHGVSAAKAAERWPNLTVKKIPKAVLAHCEWGHDDYSLNVANLPMAEPEPVSAAAAPVRKKRNTASAPDLFDSGEEA